jgi:hypothetical protein
MLMTLDRRIHLKIVVFALVLAILTVLMGIASHASNGLPNAQVVFKAPTGIIVAGPPVSG